MSNWNWEELIPRIQSRLSHRYPNAPDIVQETITRLFIHLSNGLEVKVSPDALAIGIADNVQKEAWRKESRFTGIVTEFAAVTPPASAPEPSEGDLEYLKREVFSTTERKIFDDYYTFSGNVGRRRERLARKLGVSMNTLYQKVFRLKERLSEAYKQKRRDQK